MPAILTTAFSNINAYNFIKMFRNVYENEDSLYLAISRGYSDTVEDYVLASLDDTGKVRDNTTSITDTIDKAIEKKTINSDPKVISIRNYYGNTVQSKVDTEYTDLTSKQNFLNNLYDESSTDPVTSDTTYKEDYLRWTETSIDGIIISLETNPPTPQDTRKDEKEFRENIIGMVQVLPKNIQFMIPKVEWKAGLEIFRPVADTDKMSIRNKNSYCVNRYNQVFLCVYAPVDEEGTILRATSDEPEIHLDSSKIYRQIGDDESNIINKIIIVTNDGYVWQYMYEINTELENEGYVLENWIPINFGEKVTTTDYIDVNEFNVDEITNLFPNPEEVSIKGDNVYEYITDVLGSYRILVKITIQTDDLNVKTNMIYRQVGLLTNPVFTETSESTNSLLDRMQRETGSLIYLENKKPVERASGQTETVELLLVF